MGKIHVLDEETINQIAAGEVIERPSSVVKELMENAIDAMATSITVEIKDGGISFIRITDNGTGIPREEVKTAFLRHATSKIKTALDLVTVSSLGFRGEALSSIGAVSMVELVTKQREDFLGTRYEISGGKEGEIEEIGVPDGTTFIVRNLFFNVPARKKFLKTPMTEAGYINDIVCRVAMSHPEISIRFINNGKHVLYTNGNGSLKDVIYTIYGKDIAQNLLSLNVDNDNIKIAGFIGKPVICRGNRTYENYFINGRYIKSPIINKAIEEGYRNFMMQHKYPFTAIMFTVKPELLDVNVHPAKMELRFRNAEEIYPAVINAVSDALKEKELIQEAEFETEREKELKRRQEQKNREQRKTPEFFETNRITEAVKPVSEKNIMADRKPVLNTNITASEKELADKNVMADKNLVSDKKAAAFEMPNSITDFSDNILNKSTLSEKTEITKNIINVEQSTEQRSEQQVEQVAEQQAEQQSEHPIKHIKPLENIKVTFNTQTNEVEKFEKHSIEDYSETLNMTADLTISNLTAPNITASNSAASNLTASNLSDDKSAHNSIPETAPNIIAEESTYNTSVKPQQLELFDDRLLSKDAKIKHKIIGQIFETYWIVQFGDKMFIIDQHAAHEKVLYERTMKRLKDRQTLSQTVNPPIILSLSLREEQIIKEYADYFTELGYEIEEFGGHEFAVRAVPFDLFSVAKEELLMEIIDDLSDDSAIKKQSSLITDRVATMSCKAAVKGNNRLSFQEANALIDELMTLDNPYNCPHGRPTIISMSKYELEKKFKRIV